MRDLNLGCGASPRADAINVDRVALPGVDVVHDLNVAPWPFEDRAYDHIQMDHVLEHLEDVVQALEEAHRVLVHNGTITIRVPHWRHPNAFHDPTHRHYFTPESMTYFTESARFGHYSQVRYRIIHQRIVREHRLAGAPWWHLRRILPVLQRTGRPIEIHWVLQKITNAERPIRAHETERAPAGASSSARGSTRGARQAPLATSQMTAPLEAAHDHT